MKKIILLLVLLAAAAIGYQQWHQQQAPAERKARPVPNVVVYKAAIQAVRDEVEALGTSKAYESVTITPKVSDVVTSIRFDDGQIVKQGQLLAKLQDAEQQARVELARIKVRENTREFDRISSLVTSKTVAETERDRLQTLIESARAEVEQAQAALRDRQITAPFNGRLGLRQVSVGSLVTPGVVITTLDDISVIKLDFSVPERFIQDLLPGKIVEASAVAYPDKLFRGKVVSIDSRVNPTTRAVVVRAEIPNPDGQLLPGMLMKVKLIKQNREALLLPESAIIPIQNRHYIYLANSEGVVEERQVTIGLRSRGWVEILEGVELGEQVIIRGILKVRPGDKVKVEFKEHFSFLTAEEAKTTA